MASSAGAAKVVAKTVAGAFRGKPNLATTSFFCCDIQERFRDLIWNMPCLIRTAKLMMNAASTLERPCIVTEQYPKALKHTVSELSEFLSDDKGADGKFPVHEKKLFSMCTDDVAPSLDTTETAVLFGLETHVCILQTTIDLLNRGINVYIVADAVSSQRQFDRSVALKRLERIGAIITTSESVLFELLGDADHPKFKLVSKLVVAHNRGYTNALSSL